MVRAEYWVRHVQSPVRFADGMHSLAATGCRTFVEIGPNPNLLAMGMGCVKDRRTRSRWLPSLTKARSGGETMLYSLAELSVRGANVNWRGFHEPFPCSRVSCRPTHSNGSSIVERIHFNPSPPLPLSPSPLLSWLPSPDSIAARVEHLRSGLEDESRALTLRLDEIAIRFVINALRELGFAWHVGSIISEDELDRRVPARHRPKVSRVLSRLVERGLLQLAECVYRVELPVPEQAPEKLLRELERDGSLPECDLIRRAGAALAAIWRGDIEPLTFLFPDGSTDKAAQFYSEARLLAGYNHLAGEVVRLFAEALPDGESMRILEVGAGTGGLTMHLLPQLPAE